jgi:tetratricopeptide (TPR) repeat protein
MRKGLIFPLSLIFLVCTPLIAGSDDSLVPRDKAKLGQACSLNNLRRYEQAAEILKELHQRYPRDTEISTELLKAFGYDKRVEQTLALITEMEKQQLDLKSMELIADILEINQQFERAQNYYTGLLKQNPSDNNIRLKLAEILTFMRQYDEAEVLYRKILEQEPKNKMAALWLARVYGWNQRYDESVTWYSQLIKNYPLWSIPRREKARVLGWDRRYEQAIEEYQKAADAIPSDPVIAQERDAKYNFYNLLDGRAIEAYNRWLLSDPNDAEALFDLGQVYSRQMQWSNARQVYVQLVQLYPDHFRAKQALEKLAAESSLYLFNTGSKFIEADSAGRDVDRQSWTTFASIRKPLNENSWLTLRQNNTWHNFQQFKQIYQQQFLVGLEYHDRPSFWAGANYAHSFYPDEKGLRHTFGGEINYKPQDCWTWTLSHQREQIVDNGDTFTDKLYRDNYRFRGLYNPSRRVAMGADYMVSRYSDDNRRNVYGADVAYYITHEPRALKLIYRFEDYRFNSKRETYFSPSHFYYNMAGLEWTHYLNKEEMFWGANDTFYAVGYAINFDVGGENGHRLYVDFHHDWNSRCSSHLRWSKTMYEHRDTYSENQLMLYTSLYF